MKNSEFQEFLSRFNFQKDLVGCVGVERERFLINGDLNIVPRAFDFLQLINDFETWTYELSACQVEDRTKPLRSVCQIKEAMFLNEITGLKIAKELGLGFAVYEVAGEKMPLDVYPDPRYLEIKSTITPDRLSAACRVTATHFHIGMPNLLTAIHVSNYLRKYIELFSGIGDHSNGIRLGLYKEMAKDWNPPFYENEEHYFEVARKGGHVSNSRDCWHLIRISKYGTVELRMFGVTEDLDEICSWITDVTKIISTSGILSKAKLIPV
ncbi:hypothetical protein ACFL14_02240 [Patescibacteria group bacterium]